MSEREAQYGEHPLVFMGIDPGTRSCGLASIRSMLGQDPILLGDHTILTPAKFSGRDAVRYVMEVVMDEIRICYIPAELRLLGIEDFDFQGHTISASAHDTYLLVGALDELRHQVPEILWLKAGLWKQALTGLRIYSDPQLRATINYRLGLPGYKFSSEHALDAAGIALVASDRYLLAQAAGVKAEELRYHARRVRR